MPRAMYGLFQQGFDNLIRANPIRLAWRQSHVCPCTMSSGGINGPGVQGGAHPSCLQCFGVGIYWDASVGPFDGLITFMNMNRSPDEPGAHLDEKFGPVNSGSPNITLAQSAEPTVWAEANTDDQFIEVDAASRFNVVLVQGFNQYVPYFESLTIAPTGAVTTWNSTTKKVQYIPYMIVGNEVICDLPDQTPYVVAFRAAPIYLINRKPGGLIHQRPFGTAQQQFLPARFQARQLDWWIRARTAQTDNSAGATLPEGGSAFPLNQTAGRIF